MTTFIKASVLFLYSVLSWAQSVEIGLPVIGGNGCAEEQTYAQVSPDGQVLNLNFDGYVAHSYGDGGSLDRKNCTIAIPLSVPEGYQVALLGIELSGFALVSEQGSATLRVESFMAGKRGRITPKVFAGGTSGFFTLNTDDSLTAQSETIWSECGRDTILRVNTSILTQASEADSRALVIIDSARTLDLQWRRCR